jgi:hypothetical protein
MATNSRGRKPYPQDKRTATIYNVEWRGQLTAAVGTPPEVFREVVGPRGDARREAQEKSEGLREEGRALLAALAGVRSLLQEKRVPPRGDHHGNHYRGRPAKRVGNGGYDTPPGDRLASLPRRSRVRFSP